MKKYLFLLFVTVISNNVLSQNKTPDSLLYLNKNATTDSAKLESLRQILNYWKSETNDSTVYYSKELIKQAKLSNEIKKAFKGYYWLTSTYSRYGQHDSVIYYSFEGLKLFNGEEHRYPQSVLLLMVGEQYRAMRLFDESLKYLHMAWEVSYNSKRDEALVGIANRLGAVYHENQKHDEAMNWVDSSLIIGIEHNNEGYILKNRILKAAILREKGEIGKALSELQLAEKTPNIDTVSRIEILNNIAAIYRRIKDPINTIKYASLSYELSKNPQYAAYSVVSSEFLATAYFELEEYKKAFIYLREYEKLRNLLFYEERDAELNRLDAEFENERKALLIEKQNERIQQREFELRIKNLVISVIIIVLVILIFLFANLLIARKKLRLVNELLHKRNLQIESQKGMIEKKANEIEHAYIKLKELDDQKQAFISMLVHDLKNPLNLLVNIDLFEDDQEKDKLINRSSKQMLNMVMNILDINASEERELKIEKSEVSFLEIVQMVSNDVDFLCLHRGLGIKYTSQSDFVLNADKDILYRVFVNLLTNAIKFSPEGGIVYVKPQIINNKSLKISVIDNGSGIRKEDQLKVFNKYEQLDQKNNRLKGGTGLGLAFCKVAAEAHGWEIGVISEEGKGSEFFVLIDDFQKKDIN